MNVGMGCVGSLFRLLLKHDKKCLHSSSTLYLFQTLPTFSSIWADSFLRIIVVASLFLSFFSLALALVFLFPYPLFLPFLVPFPVSVSPFLF